MPKYLIHPKHPLRTLVYIILAVGLVVGGIVTFIASQRGTEMKSKAAESKLKRVVSWEFNGKTTEGWTQVGLKSLQAVKGKLVAIMGVSPSSASISKKGLNVPLGRGLKNFNIRVAVGSEIVDQINNQDTCSIDSDGNTVCSDDAGGSISDGVDEGGRGQDGSDDIVPTWEPVPTESEACVPKPTCPSGSICPEQPLWYPPGGWCLTGTPGPIPPPCTPEPPCLYENPQCAVAPLPPGGWYCPPFPPPSAQFTFTVFYETETGSSGGTRARTTGKGTFTGQADGKMRPYTVKIQAIGDVTLKSLRIAFSQGVDAGGTVSFDYIRLMSGSGSNPPRTPTPTRGTGACSTPCDRDRDCASGLKCIVPRVSGQTNPQKVCALSSMRNNRGYVCRSGER